MSASPSLRVTIARQLRDPVYANGLALVVNAGAAAALGFVFWMVAARRFDADDLGWGAAVVSASTLAALIGKAGFDAALVRYVPQASARGVRRLVLYAMAAALILTVAVCGVILFLAGRGIDSLAPLRTPLAAAGFILLAAGTAAAWILDAYYIAEQAAVVCLTRNVAFHGIKLVVPFVLIAGLAAYAVPIAWAVGLAASLAVSLALLPRRWRRHERTNTSSIVGREVAAYSAKNYVLNLAEFLPGLVLPILVLESMGAETNAGFFLAWTVASVAFLASKAIAQSAFAALVRGGSPVPAVKKTLLLSAVVLSPAILVFGFGAELILDLFGPEYSGESTRLLQLLALSIPAIAVSNLYLAFLKARRAGWELTLFPATTLVTLLVALPIALEWAGIVGIGLTWLTVQLAAGIYATARLVASLRRYPHVRTGSRIHRRAHQG